MPTCHITLSEPARSLTEEELLLIRKAVASGLISGARYLDQDHIVTRVHRSHKGDMLGEIEIEVFAQFYLRRFWNRDRRALEISRKVSRIVGLDCATWINLVMVGYARHTVKGQVFFSD